LVGERTALINQLRAILLERGLVAPQGKRKLERFLVALMDEQGGPGLSSRIVTLNQDLRRYLFPRLLMPKSFTFPPVVNWRGTDPTRPARSRPCSNVSALPIAAINAEAIVAPTRAQWAELDRGIPF
jgi:hypothetical protein